MLEMRAKLAEPDTVLPTDMIGTNRKVCVYVFSCTWPAVIMDDLHASEQIAACSVANRHDWQLSG